MNNLYKLLTLILLSITSVCHAKEKTIGLQLYSLRDDIKSLGIEKVLDEVAKMGYRTVEIAGYADGLIYGLEPAEFKRLATAKGLKVTSSHVRGIFTDDPQADIDHWVKAIKCHAILGVDYIVAPTLPWFNKTEYSEADITKMVDYFNKIGRLAAESGMVFCFHNHDHAFNIKVGEKNLYTVMLERTEPQYVSMQLDVYWVNEANCDPLHYLKKYKGRFPLLHIKDDNVIGESEKINFEEIFKIAYKQKLKAFFVEVEQYKNNPMQDVKESFNYLNAAKFVR